MSETKIMRDIQLLGHGNRVRLFRNNTGRLQTRTGTYVTYGLCVGSSDLIGWKSVEITPQMIGQHIAVFVAIEVKSLKGGVRVQQENFLRAVNKAGGVAGIARTLEEACQLLNLADNEDTLGE